MGEIRVEIQKPLVHQKGPLDSESRFKLWRWGRRAGKTRGAFIACTVGHGPGSGFLQGGDILWVARDYTQAETIWYREIKPRFINKEPAFTVSEQKKKVVLNDSTKRFGGQLRVASADNIDSERGGSWDGVVVDEAAHVDLKYIFFEVLRPGLADRKGWAILMGTTRAGSAFNTLCEREELDELGPSWHHSNLTAFDNPKIDDAEVEAMIAAYDDEVRLQQEVYASLTVSGGFAFPEWSPKAHIARLEPPDDWPAYGCLDWGYVSDGWSGYLRRDGDGRFYCRKEYVFSATQPFDVGVRYARMIVANKWPVPRFVVADSQVFAKTEGHVTVGDQIAEGFKEVWGPESAPALVPGPKYPGSRQHGKVIMHRFLRYETTAEDGVPEPWEAPQLRFHPDCEKAIRTLPRLPRSPRDPEDVDTDAYDHPYDALKYLLQLQHPRPDGPEPGTDRPPGHHPGYDARGRRKERINRALLTSQGAGEYDPAFGPPPNPWLVPHDGDDDAFMVQP